MAREATKQRRRNWLIMLVTSIISMAAFATAGGITLTLAMAPCPNDQKNSLGQCVPYSTIMWVCGPLFTTLAGLSFVWLIVLVCLRHSAWYSRGKNTSTEEVQWMGEHREACNINGQRYVISGDWSNEKDKVLIQEDKYDAI